MTAFETFSYVAFLFEGICLVPRNIWVKSARTQILFRVIQRKYFLSESTSQECESDRYIHVGQETSAATADFHLATQV